MKVVAVVLLFHFKFNVLFVQIWVKTHIYKCKVALLQQSFISRFFNPWDVMQGWSPLAFSLDFEVA